MSIGKRADIPLTLVCGVVLIVAAEVLLFIDVALRDWAVVPYAELAPPNGVLQSLGRAVSENLTPICWVAYLIALDGLFERRHRVGDGTTSSPGSLIRERPKRFIFCFLASVPIWLWFDWVNFSFIDAWRYHGLPDNLLHRNLGYFFAFGAICPAMFFTAEHCQRLGMSRLKGRPIRFGFATQIMLIGVGCAFIAFPFAARDPIGSLSLWLGWFLVLDPINLRLGAIKCAAGIVRVNWLEPPGEVP